MDRLIYGSAIAAILAGFLYRSAVPERSAFLPTARLNVTGCVNLHNEIARLGWEAMGHAPADFKPKTWSEFHGDSATTASKELSKELLAFLQGAYMTPYEHSFHYYAAGLLDPGDGMFAFIDHVCGYKEHQVNMYAGYHRRLESRKLRRYVRLYPATNLASHPEGLIFDQHTNTAIMCMSIHHGDGLCQPDRIKWYPLEVVLEKWLDMIRIGKVKAVGRHAEYRPWDLVPYSPAQLRETVDVYNALVEAIESRMPSLPPTEGTSSPTPFTQATLSTANIYPSFANHFLRETRPARFRFIAPGLEAPTPGSIANQPFTHPTDLPEGLRNAEFKPPILLFRSSSTYKRPYSADPYHHNDVFSWPFNASTYPAGLYFHSPSIYQPTHEDSVSLVLPYAIGAVGWARKSDGSMFGEQVTEYDDPRAYDKYDELYQTGHQPFVERHHVRLVKVLRSWVGMVERGDWEVGEEGVRNGIKEWRKADTRGGWEKYFIEPDW